MEKVFMAKDFYYAKLFCNKCGTLMSKMEYIPSVPPKYKYICDCGWVYYSLTTYPRFVGRVDRSKKGYYNYK